VVILRHPCPHEWSATDIDGISEASKRALRAAEVEEARVIALQERGRTAPHERKALAQSLARSKKEVVEVGRAYESVDLFRREIRQTLEETADISECPVCRTSADPALGFRSDTKFYEFRCSDRNAQWGIRWNSYMPLR
jgi:hypothetical protein